MLPIRRKNLARMTTATTGAGTITLGSAVSGFNTFANAGVTDGDIVHYGIRDGANSEVGYGTYTASGTTLTRNVIESTNSDGAISLSGGAEVFLTALAEDFLGPGFVGPQNFSIAVSAGSSALTIALKGANGSDPSASNPVIIPFRNATGTTGTPVYQIQRAALSLVISSGSTMAVTSSTAFRIWVVIFDDGGTLRLGAINCLSSALNIYPLQDDIIASSTAEGGAGGADSAHVFYTGSAVTSKAYRILGYLEWNTSGVTAGTWTTSNLSKVQLFGPGVKLPGDVVQIQRLDDGVDATNNPSTVLPADNTIPQNTEGNQYLSQAITPTSAANLLNISSQINVTTAQADGNWFSMSLFQDSTANALISTATRAGRVISNNAYIMAISHRIRAGTSSSTTFKIRAGGETTDTVIFNNGLFADTVNSYLEIIERMS